MKAAEEKLSELLQWSSPDFSDKMGHPVFALQLIHVISELNGSEEQLGLQR